MAETEDIKFYHFDKKTICVITSLTTGLQFYGEANWDESVPYDERTGDMIAETRAHINVFRTLREQARAVEDTLRIMDTDLRQSKNYNPKSKEAKAIRRQLYETREVRKEFTEAIQDLKIGLNTYLSVKYKQS